MRTPLRTARLLAGMTTAEAAVAVKVAQFVYEGWESGKRPVPENMIESLADAFEVTPERIRGLPEPFDLLGVNDEVPQTRKYFGEVAIHFVDGAPLVLPISEAERSRLYSVFQLAEGFVRISSLDNRTLFVRVKSVADIYFSSEACDEFGPEEYKGQYLGVYPDDFFWNCVDRYGDGDDSNATEAEKNTLRSALLSEKELDEAIAEGKIKPEEREEVRQRA